MSALAAELWAFVSAKTARHPTCKEGESSETCFDVDLKYKNEMLAEYAKGYSARVIAIRDDLRRIGVIDSELNRGISTLLGSLGDFGTVSSLAARIEALAVELRDPSAERSQKHIGRRLTSGQRRDLIQALSLVQARVSVCAMVGDKESVAYAKGFASVFRGARWRVVREYERPGSLNEFGIRICERRASPAALRETNGAVDRLTRTLDALGIGYELKFDEEFGLDLDLLVVIGREPPRGSPKTGHRGSLQNRPTINR